MKNHINIPIFVPHHGCPHDCTFCNQQKIAGVTSSFSESEVRNQIERYLSSAQAVPHIEIAFFGGSFTGIPTQEQNDYLDVASEYIHRYGLDGIRMSTRPDMITTSIMDNLSQYPITTIELGVQSMIPEVLIASNRGHTTEDVVRASSLIRHYGIKLGHQMMLGLPQDTPERSLITADRIIAVDPDMVRIYPTLVIKDTHLATLYENGEYQPFDMPTTIDLCTKLTDRFEQTGIDVLRIGLQATDQIQPGKDLVAGPWHPAIGQLVEEKRWLDFVLQFIKDKKEPVTIVANQQLYQSLIGHKKAHMPIWSTHEPKVILQLNKTLPKNLIKINDEIVHR